VSRAPPGTAPAPTRYERPPSFLLPSARPKRLSEGNSERLENRLEHVLRVAAVEKAHVQREAGALRELLEETRGEIALEPGDACLREVDVRDEQRPTGRLE